jgi:signal peptidase I
MRDSVAIPQGAAARSRARYARTIAVIAVQVALVSALGWFCLPQRLGGRADWVMVSGTSMLPRLHTGDLVLVERQSSYHVGEVVAYRVPQDQIGAGYVVIHRIIGGNDQTGWKLQGDNRTAPDLWHPTDHEVIGSKLLRIPDAWFVLRLFHMPILLGLVAGFAAFFFIVFSGAERESEVEVVDEDEDKREDDAPEEYGWWD